MIKKSYLMIHNKSRNTLKNKSEIGMNHVFI